MSRLVIYMSAFPILQTLYVNPSTQRVGIGTSVPVQSLHVQSTACILGNVGIGTTAPTSALHVVGGTSLGSDVLTHTHAVTGRGMLTANTGNAALSINQTGAGSVLEAQQGGTIKVIVSNAGRLGIGTSVPTALLDVSGTTSLGSDTATHTHAVAGRWTQTANHANTGCVFNQIGAGNVLDAQQAGASKVIVSNAGRLGIGTSIPTALLDVSGTTSLGSDTATHTHAVAGRWTQTTNHANTGCVFNQIGVGNVLDAQQAGTSKVVVSNAGFLGIGTSVPVALLDVSGTTSLGSDTATHTHAVAGRWTQTANHANTGSVFNQTGAGNVLDAQQAGTSKVVVSNAGFLGIGTSVPTALLDVSGGVAGVGTAFVPAQVIRQNGMNTATIHTGWVSTTTGVCGFTMSWPTVGAQATDGVWIKATTRVTDGVSDQAMCHYDVWVSALGAPAEVLSAPPAVIATTQGSLSGFAYAITNAAASPPSVAVCTTWTGASATYNACTSWTVVWPDTLGDATFVAKVA